MLASAPATRITARSHNGQRVMGKCSEWGALARVSLHTVRTQQVGQWLQAPFLVDTGERRSPLCQQGIAAQQFIAVVDARRRCAHQYSPQRKQVVVSSGAAITHFDLGEHEEMSLVLDVLVSEAVAA